MGQLVVNAVKLNKDMISYDGEVHLLEGTDDFFEAIWMHKYNGKYYLSYSANSGEIKYCISLATVVDEFSKIIETETQLYNKGIEDNNISFKNIFLVKIHLPITGMFRIEFIKKELNGYDEFCFAEDFGVP